MTWVCIASSCDLAGTQKNQKTEARNFTKNRLLFDIHRHTVAESTQIYKQTKSNPMCDRFNDFFISLTIPSIENYDHSFSELTKQFIVFPLGFDIFMTTVLYLMDACFREEKQKLIHCKIYYVASNRLSFF